MYTSKQKIGQAFSTITLLLATAIEHLVRVKGTVTGLLTVAGLKFQSASSTF